MTAGSPDSWDDQTKAFLASRFVMRTAPPPGVCPKKPSAPHSPCRTGASSLPKSLFMGSHIRWAEASRPLPPSGQPLCAGNNSDPAMSTSRQPHLPHLQPVLDLIPQADARPVDFIEIDGRSKTRRRRPHSLQTSTCPRRLRIPRGGAYRPAVFAGSSQWPPDSMWSLVGCLKIMISLRPG